MNLFFNDRERRLRGFWGLLIHLVPYVVGLVLLGNLTLVAFALFSGVGLGAEGIAEISMSPAFLAINGVGALVVALLSVWLAGHFLDRGPVSGFWLRFNREWWLDLGFGLLLGALLMTGVFLVELAAGWVSVNGTFEATRKGASFFPSILAPLVLYVCVGIYEELISRGYQIKNIAEGLNFPGVGPRGAVFLAWVLSSSLFGLLHVLNPNASIVSTANIAFAGL